MDASKSEPKQTAVFAGIGENHGQNVFFEIKAFDLLFERIVLVHRDDVLKTQLICRFCSNFEGADNLPAIDAVEEVAVVNKKAGADASFRAKPHEHHVEAEDLHVFDPLAA